MKTIIMILVVVVVALGGVFLWQHQLAQQQLAVTRDLLQASSNQAATAETQVASLTIENRTQSQIITQWVQKVQALDTEKTQLAAQLQKTSDQTQTLKQDLEAAQRTGREEKERLAALQTEQAKLVEQLSTVSGQLDTLKKQLADLEKNHQATLADLNNLRQQKAALESEKRSLEGRLNDLDSLRVQVRLVKHEMWQAKLAAWKRADEEAMINGNRGVLTQGQLRGTNSTSTARPAEHP